MSPTNLERSLTIVTGRMLSLFMALALSMMYLNHSCNAKSLPSTSVEKNGLVASSLRMLQNSENEKDKLNCHTIGCVKTMASLIKNMDRSVDPCNDFYQFACGNFIKNTRLNNGELTRNQFSVIEKEILNQKRMIITEPIQTDELRPSKMMKLLFKSCMDLEHIEKIGLLPFKEMLKSLGGWPLLEAENWDESKFTWIDSVNKFKEMGQNINYLFKLSIEPDLKNRTKAAIYLEQAFFELPLEYLVQGKDNSIVDKYFRYMLDIAVLFGADQQRATKELRDSLDFEIELAKISMSPREELDIFKIYNPMKIADLQQKFPSIPWQEFLNKLLNQLIRQDDIIIVFSPKYWSGLETLLSKTPKKVLANYVMRRSVIDAVSYLTKELRKRQIKYIKEQYYYTTKEPRWMECVDISSELFEIVIGSMYVRRFSNKNAKHNALEMVNNIKEELYKILSSNEWMDNETRKNAIDKAKSMTNEIAYPDELLDDSKLNAYYENLEVNGQDYYTSILNLTKFNTDFRFLKLRKPVNKSDWISHSDFTTMTNAVYDPQENNILLPTGILQGMFFSDDLPQYMIYGSIGSIIGHEMTHGFDNTGRKFDMHGNMVDWWAEETNKRFLEKEKCFINQYGNYRVQEVGLKLNGTQTLSENIADNGGLNLAYNAYKEWAKGHDVEPRPPRLQEYTPQQMFWLSAANVWCSKNTMKFEKYRITNFSHSIDRFRIIGSFSNMKDFSEDFRCPVGSNMNPAKKCQVW